MKTRARRIEICNPSFGAKNAHAVTGLKIRPPTVTKYSAVSGNSRKIRAYSSAGTKFELM